MFPLRTGTIKKVVKITENEEKKHDEIVMVAKNELNSIETLISQALIDLEISQKEFIKIFKEKEKYQKMKESIRMMKNDELAENNSIRENKRNAWN